MTLCIHQGAIKPINMMCAQCPPLMETQLNIVLKHKAVALSVNLT